MTRSGHGLGGHSDLGEADPVRNHLNAGGAGSV